MEAEHDWITREQIESNWLHSDPATNWAGTTFLTLCRSWLDRDAKSRALLSALATVTAERDAAVERADGTERDRDTWAKHAIDYQCRFQQAERERDAAVRERDEARTVIASTADLLNTWAREECVSQIGESPYSGPWLQRIADRLWARASETRAKLCAALEHERSEHTAALAARDEAVAALDKWYGGEDPGRVIQRSKHISDALGIEDQSTTKQCEAIERLIKARDEARESTICAVETAIKRYETCFNVPNDRLVEALLREIRSMKSAPAPREEGA